MFTFVIFADFRRLLIQLFSPFTQEFVASIDDLRSWMAEKSRTVQDESYRDLTNLERKLQKHEAFELELRANEGQLRSINKVFNCALFVSCLKHEKI